MKKSIIILLHAGYWMLYWFLFTFIFFVTKATSQEAFDNWDDWLITIGLATFCGLISFYSFYFWLVPKYIFKKKIAQFVVFGLCFCIGVATVSTVLISLIITWMLSIVVNGNEFFLFSLSDILILVGFFTLLGAANGLVSMVIRGFINWYADIHVKEMLLNKNLRTELALLKAQINPHFLFNTLNNIDVLIERDAQKASAYLNKLSEILRFVLYEAQSELIPLARELEYIKKYVELQKIRTANEDYVTLQIDGNPEELEIAPMLFIPYIENAFKYATNKKISGAIRIQISIESKEIRLMCSNAIDRSKFHSPIQSGIGNNLLKSRLDLLYKNDYKLEIENSGDKYEVNLVLPVYINELSHY